MSDTINGELFITLPEGFRAMSAEELKRGYATDFERIRGYWDEEHHVIVSNTRRSITGFYGTFASWLGTKPSRLVQARKTSLRLGLLSREF